MKRTTRTLIASVAIGGLLSGAAINQAMARDDSSTKPGAASPGKVATKKPHVQSCSGQNDCKGLGGCKTADHSCKFLNDCKGKGGCALTKADIKKWEKMQKEKKS